MKRELIFHVGYPKTATKWHQRYLFPNLPGVNFIAFEYLPDNSFRRYDTIPYRRSGHILKRLREWPALLGMPKHYGFIPKIGFYPDRLYQAGETLFKLDRLTEHGRVNLVSCEGLLRPYSIDTAIRRLRELEESFRVKIIITVRNQTDIILSRYCHDVSLWKRDYTLDAAMTDDPNAYACRFPACRQNLYPCRCKRLGYKVINMAFYDYFRVYSAYRDAFGSDRVHLAVYEEFTGRKPGYFDSMLSFMGQDVDTGPFLEQTTDRGLNKRPDEARQRILDFNGPDAVDACQKRIFDFYRESNRRLNDHTSADLEAYRYF